MTKKSLAGCCFPGRPLVEATGSLYNQHIMARNLGLSWQQAYACRVQELAQRLEAFSPPVFERPNVLLQTANDPGDAMKAVGVSDMVRQYAEQIRGALMAKTEINGVFLP